MKEEIEELITTKVESVQQELAAQFTKEMKENMQPQQTQQQEQIQSSFQQQQVTLDTTIQWLIDQSKLNASPQGASSPLNTAVATRGIEQSSASSAT
eukprot:15333232-Ditylum_brightwellii.AAC.1